MVLDCAQLTHWRWEESLDEMFALKRDYRTWMSLLLEPEGNVGPLEEEWNRYDTLDAGTKLLHMTSRATQPWKTGLPIDFTPKGHAQKPAHDSRKIPIRRWLGKLKAGLTGNPMPPDELRYRRHPDPNQEAFFFQLLHECVESGSISKVFLREEITAQHLRPDAFTMLEWAAGAPALAGPPDEGRARAFGGK
jgi:hypothetical protein